MIHQVLQKLRQLISSPGFVVGVLIVSLVGLVSQIVSPPKQSADVVANRIEHDIRIDLETLTPELNAFEADEAAHGLNIASPEEIDTRRSQIRLNLSSGNLRDARLELNALSSDLVGWRGASDEVMANAAQAPLPPLSSSPVVNAPILIYHYTPPNFEAQLQELQRKQYTAIDLDQLVAGFSNPASLPPKPVVITFDDGFANQMQAFELLKKYSMKATFYIVPGGERSSWCLGANRRNFSCGDDYLSWDQVRQLDKSGIITIADHTVDHANLPTLPTAVQHFEIVEAKTEIESQIGHPIHHFAYPYGSFTGVTIGLVRSAGFVTAVSTIPGSFHSSLTQYTLHRERDVFKLP